MSRVRLLGVPIDSLTADEAVVRLHEFLAEPRFHHVMTPNAEMLVEASRNEVFHALLQRTDLNLPDSAGLLWAARFTGQHLPERVTGVDTVRTLCVMLSENQTIFLLGGAPGVAEKAGLILRSHNPHLRIAGTYAGSPRKEDAPDIVRRIQDSAAQVLLVAYGAPAQDLWIDAHRHEFPSVRLAMGVGGTFDFLAGTRKRAPKVLRQLHLEWLWRLLIEPSRWRRIMRAVVVFPLLVIRYSLLGKRNTSNQ